MGQGPVTPGWGNQVVANTIGVTSPLLPKGGAQPDWGSRPDITHGLLELLVNWGGPWGPSTSIWDQIGPNW